MSVGGRGMMEQHFITIFFLSEMLLLHHTLWNLLASRNQSLDGMQVPDVFPSGILRDNLWSVALKRSRRSATGYSNA